MMSCALISLAEMHTLRIVRHHYPGEEWIGLRYVCDARLEEAQKLFNKRRSINEGTDLADCLQLCDKAKILCKTGTLWRDLEFESKRKADSFFGEVEHLRNSLAHHKRSTCAQAPCGDHHG
jgi:hypothetical protein